MSNEDFSSDTRNVYIHEENYLSEHPVRARLEFAKFFALGIYENVKEYTERLLFTGKPGLVSRSLCELIR